MALARLSRGEVLIPSVLYWQSGLTAHPTTGAPPLFNPLVQQAVTFGAHSLAVQAGLAPCDIPALPDPVHRRSTNRLVAAVDARQRRAEGAAAPAASGAPPGTFGGETPAARAPTPTPPPPPRRVELRIDPSPERSRTPLPRKRPVPPLLQIRSKTPGGGAPDTKASLRASAAGRAKEGARERGTVKAAAEAAAAKGVWREEEHQRPEADPEVRRRDKAEPAERGVAPGRDRVNDPPGRVPRRGGWIPKSPPSPVPVPRTVEQPKASLTPARRCDRLARLGGKVAIDYNGVLNWGILDGWGYSSQHGGVTQEAVDALSQLCDAGWALWICSYIPKGSRHEPELWSAVKYLREQLKLDPEQPTYPSCAGLYSLRVDSRSEKAECAKYFDTYIAIDDRVDLCKDYERAGILAFHCRSQPKFGNYQPLCSNFLHREGLEHGSYEGIGQIVDAIDTEFESGDLLKKVNVVRRAAGLTLL